MRLSVTTVVALLLASAKSWFPPLMPWLTYLLTYWQRLATAFIFLYSERMQLLQAHAEWPTYWQHLWCEAKNGNGGYVLTFSATQAEDNLPKNTCNWTVLQYNYTSTHCTLALAYAAGGELNNLNILIFVFDSWSQLVDFVVSNSIYRRTVQKTQVFRPILRTFVRRCYILLVRS